MSRESAGTPPGGDGWEDRVVEKLFARLKEQDLGNSSSPQNSGE